MGISQEQIDHINGINRRFTEFKPCEGCTGNCYRRKKESISTWNKRKYCTNPCYQKTQKGRIHTPEARANIARQANLNRKCTPETIKKGIETKRARGWSQHRPEVRAKISKTLTGRKLPDSRRGKNSSLWRGGTSTLREKVYATIEYKTWRKQIFERDNYTCTSCNQQGGYLQADHYPIPFFRFIDHTNINNPNSDNESKLNYALTIESLWDIRNGRTLCVPCHKATPTWGRAKQSEYGKPLPLLEEVLNND